MRSGSSSLITTWSNSGRRASGIAGEDTELRGGRTAEGRFSVPRRHRDPAAIGGDAHPDDHPGQRGPGPSPRAVRARLPAGGPRGAGRGAARHAATSSAPDCGSRPSTPPPTSGCRCSGFASSRVDPRQRRDDRRVLRPARHRAALPALRAIVEEWRSDVIVRESWEFASTLVGELHGIPVARVALGLAAVEDADDPARGRPLDAARADLGLPRDPAGDRLRETPYFTMIPEPLEDPAAAAPRRTHRFRHGTADGAEPLPDWWPGNDDPLVYVTFGSVTAAAHLPYFPALYRAAIDALAPLPVRVLLTIGDRRDLDELGPLPPNVHVEGGSRRTRWRRTPPRSSAMAATGPRSGRSPTACRSSSCRCSASINGRTPPPSPARAPASPWTRNTPPGACSSSRGPRRSTGSAPQSSACSATPRTARGAADRRVHGRPATRRRRGRDAGGDRRRAGRLVLTSAGTRRR